MSTIPPITPLPSAPQRTDDPDTFSNRADAFLGALPTLRNELAAFGLAVDDALTQAEGFNGGQAPLTAGVQYAIMLAGLAASAISGGVANFAGGSLAEPAVRIGTVGLYSSAANTLSVAIAGVERLRITTAGITVYGAITTVP